jgi:hypothetical protein
MTMKVWTEGQREKKAGLMGVAKGYIEERAYLSTNHPRLLFRAHRAHHKWCFGVVVS